MGIRLVVAAPQPGYASRLALYLKEREPQLEVGAFTQAEALERHMQDRRGGTDILVVQHSMLDAVRRAPIGEARIVVLVEGMSSGSYEGLPAIGQYQSLPRLAAEIRRLTAAESARPAEGAELWTVYSAGGGAGKTTLALNAAKQASERGYSVLYFNLEALGATGSLSGQREPDELSRLLYELTAHPASAAERIRGLGMRSSATGGGYLDASGNPAELIAMTPERLEALLDALRLHGGFDLILVDPDGGFGEWQRRLLELSGRILWVAADDAQLLHKTEAMLGEWGGGIPDLPGRSTFILNKAFGEPSSGASRLTNGGEWVTLPYIPQWKRVTEIGELLSSAAFAGGVERLLDKLGFAGAEDAHVRKERRHEGTGYPLRPSGRRDGDLLRERATAAKGGYPWLAQG